MEVGGSGRGRIHGSSHLRDAQGLKRPDCDQKEEAAVDMAPPSGEKLNEAELPSRPMMFPSWDKEREDPEARTSGTPCTHTLRT